MFKNINFKQFEEQAERFRDEIDESKQERYEQRKQRQLADMSNRKPWDAVEEGFCTTCQSFTTNYSRHGECSECGTVVVAELVEVTHES